MAQTPRPYSAGISFLRELADGPTTTAGFGRTRAENDRRCSLARYLARRGLVTVERARDFDALGARRTMLRVQITDAGLEVLARIDAEPPKPVPPPRQRIVGRTVGLALVVGALQAARPDGELARLSRR